MPELICTCGSVLRYPDAHAGKKLRCPRCQAILEAPPTTPAPPEDAVMVAELLLEPTPHQFQADRPRGRYGDYPQYGNRREQEPAGPASGKATASLIFGILAF